MRGVVFVPLRVCYDQFRCRGVYGCNPSHAEWIVWLRILIDILCKRSYRMGVSLTWNRSGKRGAFDR